ncbi:MAG: GIY-YIG nuclease family protein [Halobacteriota archaeon]|uniref:GIY-YIG nuclease family protein n=1 Tax=Halodesulfurarchaeum sp. HSR-GB TaxID=3074077 RepID=UPI00285F9624|nr:GIY-YIG nuclease family protein [Halodesulfurarchaeum sp. HSR-GB]MDR5657078.1 GIY-YIG nuclease family protein [Halodesulfurarchaeum sp. HSR-GB]
MGPGTYTVLVKLDTARPITFGAAGERSLDAGYYAYTGSAFGPGGLSRVDRHRRVAAGENDTRHWHVDYLLGAEGTSWVGVWITPEADRECEIARSLSGDPITGIGATDCSCVSHLTYSADRESLVDSIATCHEDPA